MIIGDPTASNWFVWNTRVDSCWTRRLGRTALFPIGFSWVVLTLAFGLNGHGKRSGQSSAGSVHPGSPTSSDNGLFGQRRCRIGPAMEKLVVAARIFLPIPSVGFRSDLGQFFGVFLESSLSGFDETDFCGHDRQHQLRSRAITWRQLPNGFHFQVEVFQDVQ